MHLLLFIAVAPLSLTDAVEHIVSRGPEALAIAAEVAVARADVRAAGAISNPTIAGIGAFVEPIATASLQLRLPIFGQRGAHVRAAEEAVRAAQASVDRQRWMLRREARLAYYDAARADAAVAIANDLEALVAQVARIAAARLEAGTGSRLEQQQAALLHARSLQEVRDRQSDARRSRLALGRLLGATEAGTALLSDPLERVGSTPTLEALLTAASQHPDLRLSDAVMQVAQAQADAARADLRPLPTLDLGVDLLEHATCTGTASAVGSGARGRCLAPHLGLAFDLPLFNWNRGPIERALADKERESLVREASRVRIDAGIRSAFDGWVAANERARFYGEELVPVATAVEAMAREGFATGKSGLVSLLEAERGVLEARVGRVNALAAMQAARAELEEVSGVPQSLP